jgi:hypothetical protein
MYFLNKEENNVEHRHRQGPENWWIRFKPTCIVLLNLAIVILIDVIFMLACMMYLLVEMAHVMHVLARRRK